MTTQPEVVRGQLAVVTATASAELAQVAAQASNDPVSAAMAALNVIVPSYYDTAGALALAWYDELRDESRPSSLFAPEIVGTSTTDWIEREIADLQKTLEGDLEAETQRMLDEVNRLAEKEVARGFRATVIGNSHVDEEAIGWSRVARPGACKFCTMLAAKGAVYTEATVDFAAHGNCNCATRPEFRNGEHGPEASVEQYLASSKRRTPEQRARLREYLNHHYPDAPG